MSNYPAGVSDDDPYFGEFSGQPESEAEFQSRRYRQTKHAPEHAPDCLCDECVDVPY